MPNRKYISIPDLAKMLGVSRVTVYNRVKKGEIAAEKVGRTYVITDKTVDNLLNNEPTTKEKEQIDAAVKRTVREYGDVLRKLATERAE